MASERRKLMFASLVFAAGLDGKISGGEQARLKRYARTMGLTEEEAKEIIQTAVTKGFEVVKRPKDPATRRAFFDRFVKLVRTDGKIDAKEEKFLRRMAPYYEVTPANLEALFAAPREKETEGAKGLDAVEKKWSLEDQWKKLDDKWPSGH